MFGNDEDLDGTCEFCDEPASDAGAFFDWLSDPMCARHLLEELAEVGFDDFNTSGQVKAYANRLSHVLGPENYHECQLYSCSNAGHAYLDTIVSAFTEDGYFPIYDISYWCGQHAAEMVLHQFLEDIWDWQSSLNVQFHSTGIWHRDLNR